ncbi:MAG: hypothetical protein ACRDL6_07335 [Solirubrobacterales bacterium]
MGPRARTSPAVSDDAVGTSVDLDLYGLGARISGDWPEVVESLRLDFAWFARPLAVAPQLEVVIERRPPELDSMGNLSASFVTPRNVVYQDGGRTVIDYFGQAVSVLDRAAQRLVIQGEDEGVLHQAGYLFLLSRLGEHLDARGLPRLHGLGLAGADGGVVTLLPSGGGKTSLALEALRSSGVKLISEDSPLIDRRGRLHPLPLRIGIHPDEAARVGEQDLRRIDRMEFGPKLAIEVSSFRDRIATEPVPLRHLVIGQRRLGTEARLEQVPRRVAIGPLFREAVVGVGLYQGMEFVLQRGISDVRHHAGTAIMRALWCAIGLGQAKVWRLETGRDHERNWAALRRLL